VTFLAEQAGVRQFLDIGTGLPTANNTHDVAQAIAPESRIVYVDNDPLVLVHARALLTSSAAGATAYVEADLREPDKILKAAELRDTLDLARPVALMMIATLHFIPDADDPFGVVAQLLGALPPGSYLVISHATSDGLPPALAADIAAGRHGPGRLRTRSEFAGFFTGLELVPPGIVSVADWRADDEPQPRPSAETVAVYGAVGRLA
jgi:hypothetical protein